MWSQVRAMWLLILIAIKGLPGLLIQDPVGNSMGQGIPSTMFANSERQMPGNALFGSFMCHYFPL